MPRSRIEIATAVTFHHPEFNVVFSSNAGATERCEWFAINVNIGQPLSEQEVGNRFDLDRQMPRRTPKLSHSWEHSRCVVPNGVTVNGIAFDVTNAMHIGKDTFTGRYAEVIDPVEHPGTGLRKHPL